MTRSLMQRTGGVFAVWNHTEPDTEPVVRDCG
ncbi:hypothetical protein ABIA33_005955 [Streptacidiphilus sp. MAP12-16]